MLRVVNGWIKGAGRTPVNEIPTGDQAGWLAEPIPADVQPLTDGERHEAEQVARRVHAELCALVLLLPEGERGASAMARTLGLDRATCQRVASTVARAQADAVTLVHLPGCQGLRQFVEAVSRRVPIRPEQLDGLRSAIGAMDETLDRLGGSQRRFRHRMVATVRAGDGAAIPEVGANDPAMRQKLFNLGAAVTGGGHTRWCRRGCSGPYPARRTRPRWRWCGA